VEQLAAALKRANERIRILEMSSSGKKSSFPTGDLRNGQLAIWRAAQEFKRSKPNEQGLYRIYIQKMAEDVGISAALGRSINTSQKRRASFERTALSSPKSKANDYPRYIAPHRGSQKNPTRFTSSARTWGGECVYLFLRGI